MCNETPKVRVCERVAQEMLAMNYCVFDVIEDGQLVSYVYENQYNNFKESFRSY